MQAFTAAARSVPFRGGDKVEAALVAWCITDRRKDFRCLDENFGFGHVAWSLGTKLPGKSGGIGGVGAAGEEELGGGITSWGEGRLNFRQSAACPLGNASR